MPENLLNQDFGIPKSILSQVTANPDNVSVHKHYLGSDGQIHEGILEERGRSQYAGGVGSGQEDDGTKYVSLNAIPEGVYRKNGKDWAPEVRIREDELIAYLQTQGHFNWNVVDLGVGQSFNVSGYPGYKSFTNSNFICETQGLDWTGGNYWTQGDVKSRAGHKLIKSYNASSGVLTAKAEVTGGINGGNVLTVNVRAYLKYKP